MFWFKTEMSHFNLNSVEVNLQMFSKGCDCRNMEISSISFGWRDTRKRLIYQIPNTKLIIRPQNMHSKGVSARCQQTKVNSIIAANWIFGFISNLNMLISEYLSFPYMTRTYISRLLSVDSQRSIFLPSSMKTNS